MRRQVSIIALGVLAAHTSVAHSVPDYGLDWVTIGDPGNRGATAEEVPLASSFLTGAGSVDYEYRIMQTKVTSSQWIEFVEAYSPHWTGQPFETDLTGLWVVPSPLPGGGFGSPYEAFAGTEKWAIDPAFYVAARFANWLHNGKASEAWAFESGAYDMSSLVFEDGRVVSDNLERSPDAKFWIPSVDEWIKAVHWDPNKDGVGGYWRHPDGGDDPLIAGLPGAGETFGDLANGDMLRVDVGSYPDTQSPWGLLDVSGHWFEFTETRSDPTEPGNFDRYFGGSSAGLFYADQDRIDDWFFAGPTVNGTIRLASVVPAPGAGVLMLASLTICQLKRARRMP